MIKRILPYIGPLIGLTGISLGLYFHAQSVQDRKPLYYLGRRATIVDSAVATPSPVQVLYQGHPVGNTNVIEVVLYFWNGGKLPIRTEDVLDPVAIQLSSGEILESRIVHISRSVTKFEIHPVAESLRNVVPISFGILEHDDGAAIQLIYAGKSDAAITVRGTIVGAGTPRFFSEGPRLRSPEEVLHKWAQLERVRPLLEYLGAAVQLVSLVMMVRLSRRRGEQASAVKQVPKRAAIAFAVILLVQLAMIVDTYLDTHRPEVPYSVLGH
jgi:hypothetical protein